MKWNESTIVQDLSQVKPASHWESDKPASGPPISKRGGVAKVSFGRRDIDRPQKVAC